MIAAIVKSTEDKVKKIEAHATASTSLLEFAVGGTAVNVANESAKVATVGGGIVMRGIVKGGKLAAAHNSNDDDKVIQLTGITAVNKLLKAIEDIVKKTVNNVLKEAKVK
ncbi:variable large family protein [Borrelia persica]